MDNVKRTRTIVYAGLLAAVYVVLTVALGPISFGPLQLRVAVMLYPAVLLGPEFVLAFTVGTALANLTSPFGFWDFAIMPLVVLAAGSIAYSLRPYPWIALVLMSAIIAAGVALFPLGIVAGLPFLPTFTAVFVSVVVLVLVGYAIIWSKYGDLLK